MTYVQGQSLHFRRLLVVIKQTAYEEYSQLKLRGQAPKALRWKRLESRYKAHKQCVNDLLAALRHHKVDFTCVNRVELDRQHLANVDLVVAVGGDGTVLSASHFLDHGTIPLLGINSDPITRQESMSVSKQTTDERRSHGALCACTSNDMHRGISKILYGGGHLSDRTRIQCILKSTFTETRLVPTLNDMLICNPSPAAVSRFRMGWLEKAAPISSTNGADLSTVSSSCDSTSDFRHTESATNVGIGSSLSELTQLYKPPPMSRYGATTRFGGNSYDVKKSINVWSSGMWVSTSTGSTAAIKNSGGQPMERDTADLQYVIREHMIEADADADIKNIGNQTLKEGEKLHLRWNSQKGTIFIDGAHMSHGLDLGDEILITSDAPPLKLFLREDGDEHTDAMGLSTA